MIYEWDKDIYDIADRAKKCIKETKKNSKENRVVHSLKLWTTRFFIYYTKCHKLFTIIKIIV